MTGVSTVFRRIGLILGAAALGLAATGAPAGAASRVDNEHTSATLSLESPKAAPGSTVWAMLTLTPEEHWHTYWRNPGDSGIPTTIDWTLPEGYSAGAIEWPAPQAIPVGPLMNYGYHGAAQLLVPLTVPGTAAPGDTVTLRADAKWLVCEDVCVPEEAKLDIPLAIAARGRGGERP